MNAHMHTYIHTHVHMYMHTNINKTITRKYDNSLDYHEVQLVAHVCICTYQHTGFDCCSCSWALKEVRVDDHGAVQVLLKLPQKRGAYRESDAASAGWHFLRNPRPKSQIITVGALIIRIGFWGPVYYTYKRKPPKQYY